MHVKMTVGLALILALLSACAATPHSSSSRTDDQTTMIYLVRHAEKDLNIKSNPPLTPQGHYRASQLARLLSKQDIAAVYSTNTTRTLDTAKPIANSHNINVIVYSPNDLDIQKLVNQHLGKSVVFVGHSNTTPGMVNDLIGEQKYADLSEKDYNSFFIVNRSAASSTAIQLVIESIQPSNKPTP